MIRCFFFFPRRLCGRLPRDPDRLTFRNQSRLRPRSRPAFLDIPLVISGQNGLALEQLRSPLASLALLVLLCHARGSTKVPGVSRTSVHLMPRQPPCYKMLKIITFWAFLRGFEPINDAFMFHTCYMYVIWVINKIFITYNLNIYV